MWRIALTGMTMLALVGCETAPTASSQNNGQGGNNNSSQPGRPPSNQVAVMPNASGVGPGSVDEFKSIAVGDRVYFDSDKATLNDEGREVLKRQSLWLQRYAQYRINIEGHCDERGTREYNLALGARRAEAVKVYLIGAGINASRVDTISYGKERPVELGNNDAAWAKNRRAVTVVSM